MGNQGMKNWKFSAFFVIALTLVAGLFADTAIAGNGDGTMVLTPITAPTNAILISAEATATPPRPLPVLIGGYDEIDTDGLELVFTYTVDNDINMNGGWIRLQLPDGWSANIDTDDEEEKPASYIDAIADGGTNLYMRSARLTSDSTLARAANNAGMRGPALNTARGLRRVNLYDKDGNLIKWSDSTEVRRIEVELDAAAWGADRTGTAREVTITLKDVKVPIPASLDRVGGMNYKSYRFTAWSRAKGGNFVRLKPYNDETTGKPVEAHPRVNVGNISNADAKTGTIDPVTAYLGDQGDLTITYKATGPIYDQRLNADGDFDDPGEIDAQIVIDMRRLNRGV